jgi:hypothetical protein
MYFPLQESQPDIAVVEIDHYLPIFRQVEVLEEENRCLLEKNEGNVSKIQELECQIEVLEEESKGLLEKAEENNDFKIQELECRVEVLMEENRCLVFSNFSRKHLFSSSSILYLHTSSSNSLFPFDFFDKHSLSISGKSVSHSSS